MSFGIAFHIQPVPGKYENYNIAVGAWHAPMILE